MNQQDELAQDIRAVDGNHSLGAAELAERLIERGWSRPCVVETVADLDDLPKGTVVLTEQGGVYEAGDPGFDRDWWETGQEWTQASMDLALPATVIHLPEETP
ncbi:hypothetical protein GS483_00310 [Rhodococcus hoagii]|nr:hypothetical protein [Prescottella equi]